MIRSLAFSVLATGAPHAPVAPLTVILQSIDGSSVTCPAQAQAFDLVIGRSTLTVIGLSCSGDLIFRNGLEAPPIHSASSQLSWPQPAHSGPGDWARDVIANNNTDAIARVVAAEPRVDGTRMDGKATTFSMRRPGNRAAQLDTQGTK